MDDGRDDELDNVFPLPRRTVERNKLENHLEELPVRPAGWKARAAACDHRGAWIDEAARTLKCRKCGVELDPIEHLGKIAHRREQEIQSAHRWRRETDDLMKTVERLRREETNAKSRIRTARKKLAAIPDEVAAIEAAAEALVNARRYGPSWDETGEVHRGEARNLAQAAVEGYLAVRETPAAKTA